MLLSQIPNFELELDAYGLEHKINTVNRFGYKRRPKFMSVCRTRQNLNGMA
jgi:hypothetical protein